MFSKKTSRPLLQNQTTREVFWLLLALFGVLTIGIGSVGYRFYIAQERRVSDAQNNELQTIARSKASEIASWRRERIADVRLITEDPFAAQEIRRLADGTRQPRTVLRRWLELFMGSHEYRGIVLLDRNRSPLLSAGIIPSTLSAEFDSLRWNSSDSTVVFSDIFPDSSTFRRHLNVVASVGGSEARQTNPFAYVVLVIDPAAFLLPMIESWPSEMHTAETVLVRRNDDDVVILTRPRFSAPGAGRYHIPLLATSMPVVKAVQGIQGPFEGVDYRGVRVVAATRQVADSPWFIVAKVDRLEAFEEARTYGAYVAALTLLLIAITGSVMFGVWRRQQLRSVLALLEAETARKALTKHYEFLTKYANDIILMTDGNEVIVEANDRAVSAYGYTREELLGRTIKTLVHGTIRPRMEAAWTPEGQVFESVHLRRDGSTFPVEVSARLIAIDGSEFCQRIVRDITDRKRAEDQIHASLHEKEVLLKEIHHRVKNNLQVVSSLLAMESERIDDPHVANFLHECRGRIRSMASVHEKLYRSVDLAQVDFGDYLRTLTAEILSTVKDDNIQCRVDADGTRIDIDKAVPCGLIVNELVSNSLKHGFPDGRGGIIKVSFKMLVSGQVELVVEDNGVGFGKQLINTNGTSLGMTLVDALVNQLAGTLTAEGTHGSRFIVSFALS